MGQLSADGYNFLKGVEGYLHYAYKDGRYYSVGLGHNGPEVQPNRYYSDTEIMAFFAKDKVRFEADVNRVWHEPMTQSMFDALFSLAYNHGNVSSTAIATLCKNNGWKTNKAQIMRTWPQLYTLSGKLVGRRKKEVALFYSDGSGSQSFNEVMGNLGSTGGVGTGSMGSGGVSDSGPKENAMAHASYMMENFTDDAKRTRIYKESDPTIMLDMLAMELDEGKVVDGDTTDENSERNKSEIDFSQVTVNNNGNNS